MKRLFSVICMLTLVLGINMAHADEDVTIDISNRPRIDVEIDVDPRIDVEVDVDPRITVSPRITVKPRIRQDQEQDQDQDQLQLQGQKQGQRQKTELSNNASQTVTIVNEDKREFLNAPGVLAAPGVVMPFKQDSWINAPVYLPGSLTFKQADDCRAPAIDDEFDGRSREKSNIIALVYTFDPEATIPPAVGDFVGSAWAEEENDRPFMTSLCEAAYRAMEEGINFGFVSYVIRPETKTGSFGLGASAAGSALPAASAGNPYSVAGTVAPTIGTSKSWVEGELTVLITGFRK